MKGHKYSSYDPFILFIKKINIRIYERLVYGKKNPHLRGFCVIYNDFISSNILE